MPGRVPASRSSAGRWGRGRHRRRRGRRRHPGGRGPARRSPLGRPQATTASTTGWHGRHYEMFLRRCSTSPEAPQAGGRRPATVACGRCSSTTPWRAMSPTITRVTPTSRSSRAEISATDTPPAQRRDGALLAAQPSELLVDASDRPHQRLQLEVVVGRAGAPTGDRVGAAAVAGPGPSPLIRSTAAHAQLPIVTAAPTRPARPPQRQHPCPRHGLVPALRAGVAAGARAAASPTSWCSPAGATPARP